MLVYRLAVDLRQRGFRQDAYFRYKLYLLRSHRCGLGYFVLALLNLNIGFALCNLNLIADVHVCRFFRQSYLRFLRLRGGLLSVFIFLLVFAHNNLIIFKPTKTHRDSAAFSPST